MAYGFSVFWLPLSRAIGITQPAPGDWKISTLGWMFTLFFVMLGSSAALFGASFLILCDLIARTALGPVELPVGTVTAILGGPFFLWLLFRRLA